MMSDENDVQEADGIDVSSRMKKRDSPSPWLLLTGMTVAVFMCSSAGVVFAILTDDDVPPALAASWRLWAQAVVLTGPFVRALVDARRTSPSPTHSVDIDNAVAEDSSLSLLTKYKQSIPLLVLSGIFLGIHFASWVISIKKTTLLHSLLWVSMGPIIINWGQWLIWFLREYLLKNILEGISSISRRPSFMESTGAVLGLGGAIIMLLDVGDDDDDEVSAQRPTLEGNMWALLGAFSVSIYLIIGQRCRQWMNTWLYAFPVVATAVLTCIIFALVDVEQPATFVGLTSSSIFGFLSAKYLPYSLYLGAGPGVCGHTLINGLLKYLSPLLISTALLMEPLVGSLLGYFLGYQDLPTKFTIIGGVVLLLGLLLVVIGENNNNQRLEEVHNANSMSNEEVDRASNNNL